MQNVNKLAMQQLIYFLDTDENITFTKLISEEMHRDVIYMHKNIMYSCVLE